MPNGHTFSRELEISGSRDVGFLCEALLVDEPLFSLQKWVIDYPIQPFFSFRNVPICSKQVSQRILADPDIRLVLFVCVID
jgi:hypothetical protein